MDFYESIKQGLEEALEYQQEKINRFTSKSFENEKEQVQLAGSDTQDGKPANREQIKED